ncbi:MAG: hypothetical protein ABI389_16255 [Rhodanobacter sp.]
MGWDTLGTWAAVVVALGISLRDTLERGRARTARHLLVAATILPEVSRTQHALKVTIAEARGILANPHAGPGELQDAAGAFLEIAASYGLQSLSKYLERDDALPEHILIPLAKAITLLRMLAHNGALVAAGNPEDTPGVLRSNLEEWCLQAQGIVTSLEWVVLGTQRKLKSRRWSRPELFGS